MLMEKDNTDSEIEIESEDSEIELELDTDNQSFYHFDPTHFQESSNTVAKVLIKHKHSLPQSVTCPLCMYTVYSLLKNSRKWLRSQLCSYIKEK